MDHLQGRNVTVDAVEPAMSLYIRHGFGIHTWRINIYGGTPPRLRKLRQRIAGNGDSDTVTGDTVRDTVASGTVAHDAVEVKIEAVTNVDDLMEYDQKLYPVDFSRKDMWQFYKDSGLDLIVAKQSGIVVGFAGMDINLGSDTSYKIGPLYADSLDVVRLLCLELLKNKSGVKYICLYTPEPNEKANMFCRDVLGLEVIDETRRLYTQHEEKFCMDSVYSAVNTDFNHL